LGLRFVIDLYDPARPRILGELKIHGFSTYMHRVDPNHLLSIGFDADDPGQFAYFDGAILQLFDVSNPTEPKLIHKEKIGTPLGESALRQAPGAEPEPAAVVQQNAQHVAPAVAEYEVRPLIGSSPSTTRATAAMPSMPLRKLTASCITNTLACAAT
jgi:hypothetical protein